jgi:hypothetical protein
MGEGVKKQEAGRKKRGGDGEMEGRGERVMEREEEAVVVSSGSANL